MTLVDLKKKTDFNAKITKIEIKIPSINGLPPNAELTAVANKVPNIFHSVKKASYDANISEIEKKLTDHDHHTYITTSEFNKLTAENFAARLAQAKFDNKDRS